MTAARAWPRIPPLQYLLVFVPLAVIAEWRHAPGVVVFGASGLAIIPLAGLLGDATESLADRFGAGAGALLNATFGNAAELIIALAALRRGLDDVVKASLTGSILGNALLVLGLSILAGGVGRERQTFNRAAATSSATLLTLAAIGLVVPAIFPFAAHFMAEHEHVSAARALASQRDLSTDIAIVLFLVYVASLIFSLGTHRRDFAGAGPHPEAHAAPAPPWRPLVSLLLATAAVAWMSELLVGAVDEASHALGLTRLFVGVIVVAVVGNAAEHSAAVKFALQDRMDVALHIAVGSSLQIALFVAPVLVFLSYAIAAHPLDLHFTLFEVVAVTIAVSVVNLVASDGESNWLEGVLLVAVYVVLGIAFYFLP